MDAAASELSSSTRTNSTNLISVFVAGVILGGLVLYRIAGTANQQCVVSWEQSSPSAFQISGVNSAGNCFTLRATPSGGILTETSGVTTSTIGPSIAHYLATKSVEKDEIVFQEVSEAMTASIFPQRHVLRFTLKSGVLDDERKPIEEEFELQY